MSNVIVATFFSQDASCNINVFNGFFNMAVFKNQKGGGFQSSGPVDKCPLPRISMLTKIGRVCKSMLVAPIGTTKTMAISKFVKGAKAPEAVLMVTFSKEMKQNSLYQVTFSFVETRNSYSFEFMADPLVKVTSEDMTMEMESTDAFTDFFTVFNSQNLTILKAVSNGEKVAVMTSGTPVNAKAAGMSAPTDDYDDIKY